ncbi:MAG: acyloxyacyl hydrolase [Chthonomonas sp.]|nr:acyloxyacyl hydrolase [Chthonomonas sp.]
MTRWWLAGAILAPMVAKAGDYDRPIFYLSGGKSWQILGSQDLRNGYGLHVQFAKPDKRLSFRQNRAKLVWEGYYMHSTGGRPNRTDDIQTNLGVLAMGRFEQGQPGSARWYWEAGWGLQYISRLGPDINLHFNSTPTFGAGYVIPMGSREMWLGARYLHISNGGFRKPNQGQNWMQLLVGVKF